MIFKFKLVLFILLYSISTISYAVDYPIVAVKAPRYGDDINTKWQEVFHPAAGEVGTDLVIINPDGSEETLVDSGQTGTIYDPSPSLDGEWVYYALAPNINNQNNNRPGLDNKLGSDIFKINIATREIIKLTNQEWTPATGATSPTKTPTNIEKVPGQYPNHGIFNTGPCEVPGGRIIFTSNRNTYESPSSFTYPNFQLWSMDTDGKNVEQIGHLNIDSALHPTLLNDGYIMWSSYESQGQRDMRNWGLWKSKPDGQDWSPLLSAFIPVTACHFQTQRSDGTIIACLYYNANNNGFGTFLQFPYKPQLPEGIAGFGSPILASNSKLRYLYGYPPTAGGSKWVDWAISGYQPFGISFLTPFCNSADTASNRLIDGRWLGKVTHPSSAPDNAILCVWSPGPCNNTMRPVNKPFYQGQIVLIPGGDNNIDDPNEFILVKSDLSFNYQQPRAVVSWKEIYGSDPPKQDWVPNKGEVDDRLPVGTPFGLVGTSSVYNRNTESNGDRTFGTWSVQGGDVGKFTNADIQYIRILQTEPASEIRWKKLSNNIQPVVDVKTNWKTEQKLNERLRILGEIALRKEGAPRDPKGDPDTSFLAKIPADLPFTFQLLDKDKKALVQSMTWHQLRPGEKRVNCGGCHAHAESPVDFDLTMAAKPDYQVADFTGQPKDVEFDRDILPIIKEKCQSCHNVDHPTLDLVTDPYTSLNKVISPQAARLSKLVHKIDGQTEVGLPVEGSSMPPIDKPQLTNEEKQTIYTWIDLGQPQGVGIFTDNLKPTLHVQSPRSNEAAKNIIIGAYDNNGLQPNSLKIVLNGEDITSKFTTNNFVWTASLDTSVLEGILHVEVKDTIGNIQFIDRSFKRETNPRCEEILLEIEKLKVEFETLGCPL